MIAVTDRLKISIPLVQAPMAGVQNWKLAAAVSEAGGLGSIPCGMLSVDQILNEIESYQRCTDKPFNLNFFCHTMPKIDPARMQGWQNKLAGYYEQYGVSPPSQTGTLRLPFDEEVADSLESVRPPVFSFHFGLPSAHLLARIKNWGSVIMSSATTVEEAIWLAKNGADIVIAQGIEAGGHRAMFMTTEIASQLTTADLVADLAGILGVPIIAAGGIGTREDIQQLLGLGASGVQIGTSYLLCNEADTSQVHREALKDLTLGTKLTNVFSGRLARGINNTLMTEMGPISGGVPDFPYAATALGSLRLEAESRGESHFSPLWSGQNRTACQEVSAASMTRQLWFGE